ncbi:MAG: hypothetical protein ABI878_02455 [Acidobacteriota bacterium]
MSEKTNIKSAEDRLKEMPVQTENIAFAPEDMRTCTKCGRANPPNRLKCFYCAADILIDTGSLAQATPLLRRLEAWEKGFNVVALSRIGLHTRVNLPAAARELGLERDAAEKLFASNAEIPVARVEGQREANVLRLRLKNIGIETTVIADESLHLEKFPRRIRALEFKSDQMVATDFNTAEKLAISAADLILVVSGTMYEMKTASIEKRKRSKSTLLDQTETAADESVIDLYTRQDETGMRIYQSGFDFSCLAANKGLLASENMPKLVRRLIMTCVNATLDEKYAEVRDALGLVWELETRKDYDGLRRSGFGKKDFGNVVTVNNHSQFNRYSRLRRLI